VNPVKSRKTPEIRVINVETAAERYAREAKKRLAERIGDGLAEEFTSVAASTDLNVVNVAELMASAYLIGNRPADPVAAIEEDLRDMRKP
jgi:hypothetical protein